MINKDFKKDWKIFGGEVGLLSTNHFSIDIDKDYFSISISMSWKYRLVYIAIGHLVFRFY